MSADAIKRTEPLIKGISQFEVDFVIPRVGIDLPIGIDPFLLYKSRDPELAKLHDDIISVFSLGGELVKANRNKEAEMLFSFPEVAEIGFGYSRTGKHGAGVGDYLASLVLETLRESPGLIERGIKHIEELQLLSVGIGPDRVSDIAGGIIKAFLIGYTRKQAETWGLALQSAVPIKHIFDQEEFKWYDGYFDLPISPYDNAPILLVPRRMVRSLPWINYDDFLRMEFSAYLRAKKVKVSRADKTTEDIEKAKSEVISISRKNLDRVYRYVAKKEASSTGAQPSQTYIDQSQTCKESEDLKARLQAIQPGTQHASAFQKITLEILNFLFAPELIDGEMEVRTIDGTERRDIIFTNDSDLSFWTYLRQEHSSLLLMFETKNTSELDNTHLNQTATYLGDRLGRVGFVVTRQPIADPQLRKVYSIYNDSQPRKIILVLADKDLVVMADMKCAGQDPMRHVQKRYREFRQRVQ